MKDRVDRDRSAIMGMLYAMGMDPGSDLATTILEAHARLESAGRAGAFAVAFADFEVATGAEGRAAALAHVLRIAADVIAGDLVMVGELAES